MKFISKIFLGVNLLLVIATIAAYLSPFVNPTSSALLSYFGLAYPFLFLLNLIAILVWLFVKPKNAILSLITLIFGGNAICNYIGVNTPSEAVDSQVTIGTFNIQSAYEARGRNEKEYKKNGAEFKDFLKAFNHVQVLCIQEQASYGNQLIEASLDFKHKFSIPEKATMIYSKFPILDQGEIVFGNEQNSCIWVDLKILNQKIRIYNVHLESNRITDAADEVMKDVKLVKKTVVGIKSILSGYAKYAKKRAIQAQMIKAHMNRCDHPIILAGDFNDTPQSYVYRVLSKKMKDSFRESGGGFGSTFGGSLPGLRIDFVLTDSKFEHISYTKVKQQYSDHYPVICQVNLPTK